MGATQSLDFNGLDCQQPISNICLAKPNSHNTPEPPREMLKKKRGFKKEIGKISTRLSMLKVELEAVTSRIERNEAKVCKSVMPCDQKLIDIALTENSALLDKKRSLVYEIKELELAETRLRRTSQDLREEMNKHGVNNVSLASLTVRSDGRRAAPGGPGPPSRTTHTPCDLRIMASMQSDPH
eukprot:758433-Hanusia_phi.AAC.1